MSTIHRPAQPHLSWYVTVAVLAAALLALAIAVLRPTSSAAPGTPGGDLVPRYSYSRPSAACFAARPGAAVELQSVCAAPRRP